jgi:hypothetical protein
MAKGKISAGLIVAALAAWWWLARRAAPLTNAPAPAPSSGSSESSGAAVASLLAPDALVYVGTPGGAGYLTTGDDFARRAAGSTELGIGDAPRGSSYTDPTYTGAPRAAGELVYATDAAPTPDPWRDALVLDYAAGRLATL